MKRTLALILAGLQVLLCMLPISINASDEKIATEEYKFLEYLNILEEQKYPDDGISRADFAIYAARMLGTGDTETGGKLYFYDVSEGNPCAYSVSRLAEQGVVSVGEDKMFRPDDNITYAEACKIVVCLLGYGKWAEYNGGFPRGYLTAARRLDIIGNSVNDSNLKYAEMIDLLYNTLFANTYEVKSIGTETAEFNSEGKSLLELYYNYNFTEGVIESANGFSAYDDAVPEDDKIVVVNGERYNTELYMTSYLGKYVKLIYAKGKNGALGTAVYLIEEPDKNNVLEIDAADYIDYDPVYNKISYYSDKDRQADVKVKANANFVYNGSARKTDVEAMLDSVENGTIRFIDNDDDKTYDVVIVEHYRNIIVNYINDSGMMIYDKYDNRNSLDYNSQSRVFKLFANSNEKSVSDIAIGDVLTVYESDYAAVAYITTTKITGSVTAVTNRNGNTYAVINDTEYRVDNNFLTASGKKVNVGVSAEFKLNRTGDIVDMTANISDDGYSYAYIIDCKTDSAVFTSKLMLKVYIPYEGVKTVESGEELIIDGNKASGETEIEAALTGCGEITGQIVRIKLDNDKLMGIDTTAEDRDGGGINIGLPRSAVRYRRNKFGPKTLINASTIVITVPTIEKDDKWIVDKDAEDYRFAELDVSAIDLDTDYDVTTYKMNPDSGFEDIVVVENGVSSATSAALALVRSVSESLYDDEIVDSIECIHSGSESVYYATEAGIIKSKNYKQGDVIKLAFDERGRVCNSELIYSYNTALRISEVAENYTEASQFAYKARVTASYAVSVDDGVLRTYKDDANEIFEAFDIKNVKLMIYDSSQREGKKIYIGNYNDLKTLKNSASPAMIIARADQASLMELIVFQ